MAEDDFEIDIYGDDETAVDSRPAESNTQSYESNSGITVANGSNNSTAQQSSHNPSDHGTIKDQSTPNDGDQQNHSSQPYQQGVKRKVEGPDDRPVDPNATSCLMISDLNWWNTDDDIRGWISKTSCEDELKDITFSEHKVNGKSKGQAYVEFTSQQAATATKHQFEALTAEEFGGKKPTIMYSSPHNNPFKTLPKDGPTRQKQEYGSRGGVTTGYNDRGGGFRGRGNFNHNNNNNPRGGFNRNFSGPNMGGGGGGFNNNMGAGNFNMGGNFGGAGFNRGGGMMGGGMRGGPMNNMRGGRGGMNQGMNNNMMGGGMMGGMGGMGPMGGMNMPMGGMGGGMGGGMNMGFQGQPHFNPAFFGGNQQSDWQNPHGAKRPRGE